ncbi:conserved hypothetical protein [Luminiphilus syltensis NOR5-1B]|uniref:DUF3445 domain-containing protein n=2 Tax=Luminiphilus TaxID=1341118 RepID=B8KSX0_9GAMM|nr:conserved hypothetical protein [Luminiphilus syltensis NOR5-1B]
MGMVPMGDQWIDFDTDVAAWKAHKLEQRELRGDRVYRVLPEALDAAQELSAMIADLPEVDGAALASGGIAAEERLWRASLQVPDDLIIMLPGDDEGYRLVAASLCSPSHWKLPEKIGKPIRRVHDPIPRVHDTLSPKIDRFFDRIHPDNPVERHNWSIQCPPELFADSRYDRDAVPEDAPLFYRAERQTLRRLPRSNAVAFTIRIYMTPLDDFPEGFGELFAAIDNTPEELAVYKGLPRYTAALKRYRDRQNR